MDTITFLGPMEPHFGNHGAKLAIGTDTTSPFPIKNAAKKKPLQHFCRNGSLYLGWNVGFEPTMGLVGLAATYSSDSLFVSIYKLLIFFLLRLKNGTIFSHKNVLVLRLIVIYIPYQLFGASFLTQLRYRSSI